MPWEKAQLIELEENATPGFWYGNLTSNGRGGLAFGSGRYVHLSPKKRTMFSKLEQLSVKARAHVSFAHFWSVFLTTEPILFVAVETVPPSIEVFREDQATGSYQRVQTTDLGRAHKDTAITAMSTISAAKGAQLAVALSSGSILVFSKEGDSLKPVCTLSEFESPVCSVAGDATMHRGLIAASDESGKIAVWEEKSPNQFGLVFLTSLDSNYASALGLCGALLFAGSFSGKLFLFEVDDRRLDQEVITNTRCITAIDAHPTGDMILVAGEDCRASIFNVPLQSRQKMKLVFSVCVNGIIAGAAFTCEEPESLDISLSVVERHYIVQYALSS
uniref:WD repeat-containing protein 54 beta-propeller domain-containing protein n=2 Tax=Rhodosorus marinus TaxID=101924 RepID=A0A7S2ZGR4_9RHOD|mmetsp:Transcript_18657/g.75002  ORF Transcript_18657/g.75002 Transcript_18657/m.75002 type:complete len:332 (+) Transcript_18657:90-1085(+)